MAHGPLPPFSSDGLLPPGIYPLTLAGLRSSFLVTGDRVASRTWDEAWRGQLVDNLGTLAGQLWTVGITDIFVDGSFVEEKDHPNDIDGYFTVDLRRVVSSNLERDLNALDPHQIWTWDHGARRPAPGKAHPQLPMWHQYRVELYPDYGQKFTLPSGALAVPEFFQQTRQRQPKGVVRLLREEAA